MPLKRPRRVPLPKKIGKRRQYLMDHFNVLPEDSKCLKIGHLLLLYTTNNNSFVKTGKAVIERYSCKSIRNQLQSILNRVKKFSDSTSEGVMANYKSYCCQTFVVHLQEPTLPGLSDHPDLSMEAKSELEESNDEPAAKRVHSQEDDFYFKSYGDISIHEEMIRDEIRTNMYRLAIQSTNQMAGKVVLDVGAGTGILSCFCIHAGAEKVYAIEASSIAEEARKVVEANGMSDKITVIHKKVEEVDLPEKVDVIVSEWMGHFLLYESMLNSVIYARDKWLKSGGLILPGKATLYLAPITNEDIYKERIDFWKGIKGQFGVDMACLTDFARKCIFSQVQLEEIIGSDLIGHSYQIAELDIHTATLEDLNKVTDKFCFKCFGSLPFCGFVSWFTVTFDIPGKAPLYISTAPNKPTTHWKQCVMYLDAPIPVEQDMEISGIIQLTPGKKHKRSLDVLLTYQVDNQDYIRKKYYMGPEGNS